MNLGIKPYTGWIKSRRGQNLASAFPEYDAKILSSYSETANFVDYEKYKMITIGSKNVKKDDKRKAI